MVEKWQPNFWKKLFIWRYSQKRLQIIPKWDTDIFLKISTNDFLGFWTEVSTKMWMNLIFQKNLQFGDIWLQYLTSKTLMVAADNYL